MKNLRSKTLPKTEKEKETVLKLKVLESAEVSLSL